jgi:hypothetical protein
MAKKAKKLIRITQLSCDHREDITGSEITEAVKAVGGEQIVHDYPQDNVDAKIYYVCSHELTDAQYEKLWEEGDMYTGDKVFEGQTFEDLLAQVVAYIEEYTRQHG